MITRVLPLLALTLLPACGSTDRDNAKDERAVDSAAAPVASSDKGGPPAAFAACASCHAVEPGRRGVGPSLAGIWNAKAGSQATYAYSPALKNSGIVWNAETLDQWLQGPIKMVPGTKMVVATPNPANRKAIIEYIETLK